MTKEKYDKMLGDAVAAVDRTRFDIAMEVKQRAVRSDLLINILRDAMDKCPMGEYCGCIYWYNGQWYELINQEEFANMVYDIMRTLQVPDGDYFRLESTIKILRRRVLVKSLHASVSCMSFNNGVLDMDAGQLVPASPKIVTFSCANYDYDPNARGYRWQAFLDEVLPNDVYQRILQEFVGAMFVDRHKAKIEKMLVLKGTGSNGKSVVFETLLELLGRDNVTNFALDELVGQSSTSERKRNIAKLNGKRLNYASEMSKMNIDGGSGQLKALISGEPMEGRAMYGDNFTAYDIPLIMINTNHMPSIKDWSYGMRRRLSLIPFDVEIPKWKQDPTLPAALRAELPAIFNWAMEGRKRFVENQYHFTENKELERLVDEWQSASSTMLQFMNRSGYERESSVLKDAVPIWVQFKDLYDEYARWCVTYDEVRDSKRAAASALKDAGYKCSQNGSAKYYAIYGEKAMRRATKVLLMESAMKEYNLARRSMAHYDMRRLQETAERIMEERGWKRCCVGFVELSDYVGYKVNWPTYVKNGSLEGMYVMEDNKFFFNLDDIDMQWRPKYEARIKSQWARQHADEAFKAMFERTKVNQ